jgi:hypothetical protein
MPKRIHDGVKKDTQSAKRPPTSEAEALAALETLRAYQERADGVTYTAAQAAQKTINAYIRGHEAAVRERAKRLGIKGSPAAHMRKLLLKCGD